MNGFLPGDIADDLAPMTLSAAEHTLRARARFYAVQGAAGQEQAGVAERAFLLCRLHDERYALDLAVLSAVQAARGLTPLPCTPAYVAGVLNVRGTVVAVLDLAQCLGLGPTARDDANTVVLTDCADGGGQGQVGLLVHEVLGTERIALDGLAPAISGDPAIRGLADAGIVVLDLPRLLGDGRFEVYEEL